MPWAICAIAIRRQSDPQLPPPQEDAAAQAEESKRRADEADIAFRNASEAAYEAKSEASRRTRERQQPEPWEDKPTTPPAEPQPELQPEPQPQPCVATASYLLGPTCTELIRLVCCQGWRAAADGYAGRDHPRGGVGRTRRWVSTAPDGRNWVRSLSVSLGCGQARRRR